MNTEWLNSNELRSYPIRETATQISDAAAQLPQGIISDLSIVLPTVYNPYVSSVRVTPSLVSVCISSGASGILLATQFRSTLQIGKAYAMTPLVENVSGWIVYGSYVPVVQESYLFSGVTQTGIAGKAIRFINPPGVRRILRYGSPDSVYADGIVRLKAGAGMEIVKDPNNPQRIIFRLREDVLSDFVGPCNSSSSKTACGATPIRSINGVTADPNGKINLVFQ